MPLKLQTWYQKKVKLLNKFYLFIVEGRTDERSLALTLSRVLRVNFYIVRADITSDEESTVDNIEEILSEHIGYFLAEKPYFSLEDISCIIQITDTDGAFVKSNVILEDPNCEFNEYYDDKIITKKATNIIERNERKSKILNYLCKKKKIKCSINEQSKDLNYRIYYMSCNLEHVLHNKRNLNSEEKEQFASEFRKKTNENKNYLREIISSPSIYNSTSYEESWEYIAKKNNSLLRKCNFEYFFEEFVDKD